MQALGGAKQLLGVGLLLGTPLRQLRDVELRGAALAVVPALDPREDEPRTGRPADPLGSGRSLQPEDEDVLELHSLDGMAGVALDGAWGRWLDDAGRLDPRIGDGAEVADEVTRGPVGLAARPGCGELGQAGEAEEALGDLWLSSEEPLAAQADGLDQSPYEDVGTALLQRRRGHPVELEEGLDPLACLGRDLWALERRLAARDEVELAAPSDRRQPRQVGRAQLNRRPGQRPRCRRRVAGVGKNAQPGDRVAYLRALEEGGGSGEVKGDATLFHRGCNWSAPGRIVNQDANRLPARFPVRSSAQPRVQPPVLGRVRWCRTRNGSGDLGTGR